MIYFRIASAKVESFFETNKFSEEKYAFSAKKLSKVCFPAPHPGDFITNEDCTTCGFMIILQPN